ncbi:MAG: OmpA family protein [Nevskia sp.]|nr:OmpA family protein [Nevskia sp.]
MRMRWLVLAGGLLGAVSLGALADRVHVGVGIGIGPGYYYPGPYYYPPPAYYYPDPPVVVQQPSTVTPAAQSWYYCDQSGAYYPYVSTCPGGWRTVPVPAAPPAAAGPSSPITYALGDVLFAANEARLQPQADPILRGLLDEAQRFAGSRILVEGYAGGSGDPGAVALAQRRADAVRQYLVDNGVDAARVTSIGRAAQAAAPGAVARPERGVTVTLSSG